MLGAGSDQSICGRLGIRHGTEHQPRALLAPHARDHRLIGIDDREPAGRIDERRIAEPQGEIMRLAQQHDQVGPGQNLGEGAEPRIVDAARAFHRHDRDAKLLLQPLQQRKIAAMT